MTDNDFNIIKPVKGLQNIAGLTPTRRREQRKRRQNLHGRKRPESESAEDGLNESDDGQNLSDEPVENEQDRHTIDYRA